MSFSNITNKVSAVGSDAVGQEVPFEFPIANSSDLEVIDTVTLTGIGTVLSETSDYVVTPEDPVTGSYAEGGTVTIGGINAITIANTHTITVSRRTPREQSLELENGTAGVSQFTSIESAFDDAKKNIIETATDVTRCIRLKDTDLPADLVLPSKSLRASGYLSFDANGDATVTEVLTTGEVSATPFMVNLLTDADAASARTTLGVDRATLEAERVITFNILDYGAVDGEDSTVGIQAAIDTAEAVGGGIVYFPGGDFEVSSNVTIQQDNIKLHLAPDCHITVTETVNCFVLDEVARILTTSALLTNAAVNATSVVLTALEGDNFSAGDICVIFNSNETASEIITVASVTDDTLTLKGHLRYAYTTALSSSVRRIDWVEGFEIEGGVIEGNNANAAVYLGYCKNPKITGVRMTNFGSAVAIASYTHGASITNDDIKDCSTAGNGVILGGHCFENSITNCRIRRVGTGIRCFAADGNRIENNEIRDCNVGGGITLESSSWNIVTGNLIDTVADDGIGINSSVVGTRNSYANNISNNTISRCNAGGIQCQNVTHVTRIIGNTIEYCGESGILQESGSFVNISNNYVYMTGLDPLTVATSGISLGEGHSIVCAFNQSRENIGFGIKIASTADYPYIFGNTTYLNGDGAYSVNPTNFAYPVTNGLQAMNSNGLKFCDKDGVLSAQVVEGGDFMTLNHLRQNTSDYTANVATPAGVTAYSLKVYNEAGTLLGYVPVYAANWV